MKRVTFIAVLLIFGGLIAGAKAAQNEKRHMFTHGGFSDQDVQKAIEKGIKFLWSRQNKNGSWPADGVNQNKYPLSSTPLVTYALLESGENPQDPRMQKALNWLTKQNCKMTYNLGILCNAWYVANRTTNRKYLANLKKDAKRLGNSANKGSYHYKATGKPVGSWDNSCSQYGLLGVWAAARDNIEIPRQYWKEVWDHWKRTQNPDGGWSYKHGGTSATMAAAGVASMFVCFDNLHQSQFVKCTGGKLPPPIKRGLDWFDKNFKGTVGSGKWKFYYLYGVERVGLASGYKYFGTADWYKLGAKWLLSHQKGNGEWNGNRGPMVNTAFALLFLVRGQNPVLFNKLQYDGYWNNRPRDLANATNWITQTFERTVNWQIVNLKVSTTEWHDAPILYIAGSKKPEFSDKDLEKLKRFVHQGGTILSVTECGGQGFAAEMRKVYKKIFPDYELTPCSKDHDIYSAHFKTRGSPKLFELSNGVRPFVIHSDHDLALGWQTRRYVTGKDFEIAANIAMYVADSVSRLPHRGTTHWPPASKKTPSPKVKLVRLEHKSNWNPEPLAYERLSRLLKLNGEATLTVETMPVEKLGESDAKVATLTGTDKLELTEAEKQAIKKFVSGGGTLVMDAAGGSRDFGRSAWREVSSMYGPMSIMRLSLNSEVYKLKGHEIDEVDYRRRTRARKRENTPSLYGVMVDGRPGVIFSREDITGGLVGQPSFTIDGYESKSAYEIMRNIILFAAK